MPMLPTAHASLKFGHKQLDFYAAPGQVVGSDPRARADERRIQDVEGARHVVRFEDKDTSLSSGDYVAVLRLQPGPARRSRPVAVANYEQQSWTRTQPNTSAILSRSGVARNVNWALCMMAFFLTALVFVWPALHGLFSEFLPAGAMASIPNFDVFAMAVAAMPELSGLGQSLASIPVLTRLSTAFPQLAGQETLLLASLGWLIGTVVCFSARSWRLLWVPAFLGLIGLGGLALGGVEAPQIPSLIALGATALVFSIGGVINRIRDGARLEARIARLADHLLQHPVDEMVQSPETQEDTPAESMPIDAQPAAPQDEAIETVDEGRVAARSSETPEDTRSITLPPPPPMARQAHADTPSTPVLDAADKAGEAEGGSTPSPEASENGDEVSNEVQVEAESAEASPTAETEKPVEPTQAIAQDQDLDDEGVTLAVIDIAPSTHQLSDKGDWTQTDETKLESASEEPSSEEATDATQPEAKTETDEAEAQDPVEASDEAALTPVGASPVENRNDNTSEGEAVEGSVETSTDAAELDESSEDEAPADTQAQAESGAVAEETPPEEEALPAITNDNSAQDLNEGESAEPNGDSSDTIPAPSVQGKAPASETPDEIEAETDDEAVEDASEAQALDPAPADDALTSETGADETSFSDQTENVTEGDELEAASVEAETEADDADAVPPLATQPSDDTQDEDTAEVESDQGHDALSAEDKTEAQPDLTTGTAKKGLGFPKNVIPFLRPSATKPPKP